MPRDVSLSDSKCWYGGHEWVKKNSRCIKNEEVHLQAESAAPLVDALGILVLESDMHWWEQQPSIGTGQHDGGVKVGWFLSCF